MQFFRVTNTIKTYKPWWAGSLVRQTKQFWSNLKKNGRIYHCSAACYNNWTKLYICTLCSCTSFVFVYWVIFIQSNFRKSISPFNDHPKYVISVKLIWELLFWLIFYFKIWFYWLRVSKNILVRNYSVYSVSLWYAGMWPLEYLD